MFQGAQAEIITRESFLRAMLNPKDRSFWGFWYAKFYTPLVRKLARRQVWARGMDGKQADQIAEEVAAELACTIKKKMEEEYELQQWREGASFRGWLRGVTKNETRSVINKVRRAREVSNENMTDNIVDLETLEQALLIWDAQEAQEEIAIAFHKAELEPPEKEALELLGLGHGNEKDAPKAREVAAQLGISVAAILQRKSRGLQKIRDFLIKRWGEE